MNPKVPFIAILVYSLLLITIYLKIVPDPLLIVDYIKNLNQTNIYIAMFLIILLESIVYIGFYLPGQFIAVLLIVSYTQGIRDIFLLTIVSVIAVTLGASINYYLGYLTSISEKKNKQVSERVKINYKKLLLSMIHITTIALFLFDQGSKRGSKKIIWITGLLNLPYYFLIIGVTFYFKNQIMTISESSYIIFVLLFSWFGYSVFTNKKIKNV